MNQEFTAAVERALELGLETRAAAAATVRIGRNGSRRLAEEAAIGAAWNWFVGVKFEVPAAAVVAFVRERCPGIDVMRIRSEFDWRFRQRRAEWA
jgi:hypothetical protein